MTQDTATFFYRVDLSDRYWVEGDENVVQTTPTALHRGRPFAGLALGLFRDMYGNEVDLRRIELDQIISNTLAAIGFAQSRNMPGLPIDARGHDKLDAAGWIVSAEAGTVTDSSGVTLGAVVLTADWTSLGQRLIREKILTNFSPTVELEPNPVIRGGSLTNWPASIDKGGHPLFNALELSQGNSLMESTNMPEDTQPIAQPAASGAAATPAPTPTPAPAPAAVPQPQQNLAELVAAEVARALAAYQPPAAQAAQATQQPSNGGDTNAVAQAADENANRVETIAALLGLSGDAATDLQQGHLDELARIYEERARVRWERRVAQIQRENAITELAAKLVGGTMSTPRGLPAQEEELIANLSALPAAQYAYFSELLSSIVERGLVNFDELGHGRRRRGTEVLPEVYAKALRRGELTLADLDGPVLSVDLGNLDRYDLTEFER